MREIIYARWSNGEDLDAVAARFGLTTDAVECAIRQCIEAEIDCLGRCV